MNDTNMDKNQDLHKDINVTKKRDAKKKRLQSSKNGTNPYGLPTGKQCKILRMADYFKPTPCAMATYSGDDIYEHASARTGLTQTQRDNLQSSVEGSSIAQLKGKQPMAAASFST